MGDIYDMFEHSPTPAGRHLIAGHVLGQAECGVDKGYFTDAQGAALDLTNALQLLAKAKSVVTGLPKSKTQDAKYVLNGTTQIRKMKSSDSTKSAFAVTWGIKTGFSRADGADCEWIVLVLTNKKSGNQYQWVTAYPASSSYVTNHRLA
jgi:hypothetical protein